MGKTTDVEKVTVCNECVHYRRGECEAGMGAKMTPDDGCTYGKKEEDTL